MADYMLPQNKKKCLIIQMYFVFLTVLAVTFHTGDLVFIALLKTQY